MVLLGIGRLQMVTIFAGHCLALTVTSSVWHWEGKRRKWRAVQDSEVDNLNAEVHSFLGVFQVTILFPSWRRGPNGVHLRTRIPRHRPTSSCRTRAGSLDDHVPRHCMYKAAIALESGASLSAFESQSCELSVTISDASGISSFLGM